MSHFSNQVVKLYPAWVFVCGCKNVTRDTLHHPADIVQGSIPLTVELIGRNYEYHSMHQDARMMHVLEYHENLWLLASP